MAGDREMSAPDSALRLLSVTYAGDVCCRSDAAVRFSNKNKINFVCMFRLELLMELFNYLL